MNGKFEKIKYKNNFLKQVLFRIDFSPIINISEKIGNFQDKIRKDYPNNPKSIISEYNILVKENKKVNIEESYEVFDFFNVEKDKKISISQKSFLVEFFKYNYFEEFKDIAQKIYNEFNNIFQPLVINRAGLRYINKIELKNGNPYEWIDYINSSLTSFIDTFCIEKNDLARIMTQVILNRDEFKVVFNYGIYNSEYPGKISRKEFILDYDCNTTDVTDFNINNLLELYHIEIQKLFEQSIEKKLREKMEKING